MPATGPTCRGGTGTGSNASEKRSASPFPPRVPFSALFRPPVRKGWEKVRVPFSAPFLIVAVLEAFRRRTGAGVVPALIDHSAEAVQPGILVARVAVALAGLLHVGYLDPRLGVIHDDHRVQAELVFIGLDEAVPTCGSSTSTIP